MSYFSELAISHPSALRYCATCDQPLAAGRCSWCHPAAAPTFVQAQRTTSLICACGQRLGSSYCRCGRIFSAVAPRALGAGASTVVVATSRRAPSGLVALCAFAGPSGFSSACTFARACPGLFGVVSPFVRRSGPAWVVSVPIHARW